MGLTCAKSARRTGVAYGGVHEVKRFMPNNLLLTAVAMSLLSGCIVGPDYERSGLPFELTSFAALNDTVQTTEDLEAEAVSSGVAEVHEWWMNLNDPLLVQLLSQACQQNPGVLEASARIREARTRREIVIGSLWPQVTSDIGYAHRRIAPGSSGQEGRRSGDPFDSYTHNSRATWEIDLFGQIARNIEASDARAHAAQENYRDVLISLMAEIATNYVELRVLQHRHSIAEENLEVQSKNMEMADTRNKAGLVGLLDVKQAETTVRITEALLPSLEDQIRIRLNRLSILGGQPPSQEFYAYVGTGPVPQPAVGINAGIPAQLVRQRPDIRRAEKEVHAANADVGVAVADLYPQVSLLGSPSFDTPLFSKWYRSQSFGFSVGPSVRWNVFSMGRIINTIAAQEDVREQAEHRFKNSVLRAIEEVDSGLVSYRKAHERVVVLKNAAAAAAEAVGLSESTYQIGNSSFQRVVDAQRQLLQAQDQLAVANGDVVLAWIRTYRALGGGWLNAPAVTTSEATGVELLYGNDSFSCSHSTANGVSALPGPVFGGHPFPANNAMPDGEPIAGDPPDAPKPDSGRPLPILDELHQAPIERASPWSTKEPAAPLELKGPQEPLPTPRGRAWGNRTNMDVAPDLPNPVFDLNKTGRYED